MLEKKRWSPFFEKNSPCPKLGHLYPNLNPKTLFALLLESTVRSFFNFAWWWRHSYIKNIEWNSPKYIHKYLGKWVIWARFGPKVWSIISQHFSVFSKNFAVWYRPIGRQKWFNYAQGSLYFVERTATPCFIYVVFKLTNLVLPTLRDKRKSEYTLQNTLK